MRTDFREERKWKIALAYHLSIAVLQWHSAGSSEERLKKGICVLWKRPQVDQSDLKMDDDDDEMPDQDFTLDMHMEPHSLSLPEYGTDDEDQDQQSVVETQSLIQERLDEFEALQSDPPQSTVESEPIPKLEDVDFPSLSHRIDSDAMDLDVRPNDDAQDGKQVEDLTLEALRPSSSNPMLGDKSNSQSSFGDGEPPKHSTKSNAYAPLRERIAYSDQSKLFLDVNDLILDQGLAAMSIEDKSVPPTPPPLVDLSAIFPDLQPYELLDVPAVATTEGRKKSERKNERDDPNKRTEDNTYTKLTPTGAFMHCKPTLVGVLQPSIHWKSDHWVHLDDVPVTVEYEGPLLRPGEDLTCGMSLFLF
jgi:chromatin modification-related protein VID21